MSVQRFDVIIVGAGMVGAALACALGQLRLRVALVEAQPPRLDLDPAARDLRVSAISRAAQRLLENLGAWEAIRAQRIGPLREMRVWDAGGAGAIHFDSAEIGEPLLGHIIENRVIQGALWRRLDRLDRVERLCPAAPRAIARDAEGIALGLADGRRLHAALLVGADGSRSWVRAEAGIAATQWSYRQQAIVANVRTAEPHRETAWQRFLPDGPLAFLPLDDGRSSIVWSCGEPRAAALLQLGDAAFCRALTEAFDGRLGAVTETGPRAAFPLHLLHAHDYVQPQLALIGDAGHTIHPLAGQGVNLGLMDAAALAEVLRQASDECRPLGALAVLRRYERWRKGENLLMMAAMEGLQRLFGTEQPLLRAARNAGLTLTDRLGPFKHLIMRRAMGLSGDLPPLARPGPARD